MMPQFFACLTSHPLYIPSSFAVETLQLVRNLLRVDWQISPPNSSAIPLIDVDGEKIKPKTKAMKFSAALRDGNARHKKFSSLKVSIKSSTCITDHQISFHVGLYKMQKFSYFWAQVFHLKVTWAWQGYPWMGGLRVLLLRHCPLFSLISPLRHPKWWKQVSARL